MAATSCSLHLHSLSSQQNGLIFKQSRNKFRQIVAARSPVVVIVPGIVSRYNDEQTQPNHQDVVVDLPAPFSRRFAILTPVMSTALFISSPLPSFARERRSRKIIPLEDYLTTSEGLKYYDLAEGRGPVAAKGSTVQVHFDCVYRGITAVSSRESKLLAGNRVIAQPYVFQVGSTPGRERKREYADKANGLFSAQAAPKPPPALYSVVEGMKVGGKRTVIVPPENGYGKKGSNEIPPGATFDLNIELLQVKSPEGSS